MPYYPAPLRTYLRDSFTTDRATGAVNGTAAEPGPGNRVVADTESKSSISGNKLVIAGGKTVAAWGDPGYWLDAVDRVVGRLVVGRTTVTTFGGSGGHGIGWSQNASGEPTTHSIQFRGTTFLRVYDNASLIIVGTQLSTAVDYQVAVILRATGAFYFIKGGIYTYWTLVWVSDRSSVAVVYPVVSTLDSAYTADDIYYPPITWTPPAIASDSFNRSDGALGSTDGLGAPEANGGGGLTWTAQVGTWAIATNKAMATALSGGIAIATVPVSSINCIHDVKVTRAGGVVGAVVRYQDSSNYVIAYHDGTNAKLDKVVAGVTTNVISATASYSAGKILRIVPDLTKFELYYNSVRIGSGGTISDSALQTSAVIGLYTTDITNSLDDMLTHARGTAQEHGALNVFF
jgi:hypothetical protein